MEKTLYQPIKLNYKYYKFENFRFNWQCNDFGIPLPFLIVLDIKQLIEYAFLLRPVGALNQQ